MNPFHVNLTGAVTQGPAEDFKVFSVKGLRSGYVVSKIVKTLQESFRAKLVSEAGSGVIEENWQEYEIDGEHLQLTWAWHGISLSAKGTKATQVLERVVPELNRIRLNRLWLLVDEKMS